MAAINEKELEEMIEPNEDVAEVQPDQPSAIATAVENEGSAVWSYAVNFVKKFGTSMAVYLLGYFQLSAAWMICPIMLLVIREECKKETKLKQEIFKKIAMTDEREVIMARVKDLPSWVSCCQKNWITN